MNQFDVTQPLAPEGWTNAQLLAQKTQLSNTMDIAKARVRSSNTQIHLAQTNMISDSVKAYYYACQSLQQLSPLLTFYGQTEYLASLRWNW